MATQPNPVDALGYDDTPYVAITVGGVHITQFAESRIGEVMRIERDGRVFWRRDGEMVEAKVDADLARAFAAALEVLNPIGRERDEGIAAAARAEERERVWRKAVVSVADYLSAQGVDCVKLGKGVRTLEFSRTALMMAVGRLKSAALADGVDLTNLAERR